MKTHILSSVIGAGSLALVASFTPANAGSDTKSLDLKFFYHLDADMHEQDVFIMRDEDVYRVTKNDDDMTAPLYRSASYVPHAPLEPEKVGPYAPGEPLGFTLGEWLGATGAGTYTCEDGQGTLDVTFDQLMPEGVYTLWHFFMAMPTTEPFIGTFDLPVGARDGSDSVFQADAKGSARFQKTIAPCLQMSGEHLASGLAVAYHSDGSTYGPLPGEFATDTHIQLFMLLPAAADE